MLNWCVLGRKHKKYLKHVHVNNKEFLYFRRQDGGVWVSFFVGGWSYNAFNSSISSHPMHRKLFLRTDQQLRRNYYSLYNLPLDHKSRLVHSPSHHIEMGKWFNGRAQLLGENRINNVASDGLNHCNFILECSTTPSVLYGRTDLVPLRPSITLWSCNP